MNRAALESWLVFALVICLLVFTVATIGAQIWMHVAPLSAL